MRWADVLLDLASLAKASRGVAVRHAELRGRQIERYREWIPREFGARGAPQGREPESRGGVEKEKEKQKEDKQAGEAVPGSANGREARGGESAVRKDILGNGANVPGEAETPLTVELGTGTRNRKERTTKSLSREILEKFRETSLGSPDVAGRQEAGGMKEMDNSWAKLVRERLEESRREGIRNTPDEDVPAGININVFHTDRGAEMADGQKKDLVRGRPKRPVLLPSWHREYKDFRHDGQKKDVKAREERVVRGNQNGDWEKIRELGGKLKESLQRIEDTTLAVEEEDQRAKEKDLDGALVKHPPRVWKETLPNPNPGTINPDNSPTNITPTPESRPTEALKPAYVLRESAVPSTRISRLWNYSSLAAGMLGGAISEGFSRSLGSSDSNNNSENSSVFLSAANMERLVSRLSRMRGAALKLGQMMSFQDTKMLPAPIHAVLQRVQDRADYMPAWQRDRVMTANLGADWRDLYGEFEEKPMAAASIGQVHRATLKSTGQKVAVKIQFPGVADSISSDLDNLSLLLAASKMLPKGLYLNKTIDNARVELAWECDYDREARCAQRYRTLLSDEPDIFVVPEIFPQASGKQVLTMEFMSGIGVTKTSSSSSSSASSSQSNLDLTQDQRDWIGTQILRLCLREIADFRFMQTDPNWTNFLYNSASHRLELLDFGAAREYPDTFVSLYLSLLAAAARADRTTVAELSQKLGYLTGHESKAMREAHVESVLTLAEPFLDSAPETYDFADQTITERVRALIPVMVRERLAPPPEETYSLHRKLSGAFLLCARLGSRVRCREMFGDALARTELEVVR